jgi:hypothetical protein
MHKRLDGVSYNTETAKELGSYSHGYGRDFRAFSETLYLTASGRYFLYGEGGPMSKYSEVVSDNEWSGGEKIIPMSYESALKWAEKNLTGDEVDAIFGIIEDEPDDTRIRVSLSIRPALKQALTIRAQKEQTTMSSLVESWIESWIETI